MRYRRIYSLLLCLALLLGISSQQFITGTAEEETEISEAVNIATPSSAPVKAGVIVTKAATPSSASEGPGVIVADRTATPSYVSEGPGVITATPSSAQKDSFDNSLDPEDTEPPEDEVIDPEWLYPTGWEGYGDGQLKGNVLAAEKAFGMSAALLRQIDSIERLLQAEQSVGIVDTEDNFADVLAVYALLSGQTDDYPYNVKIDDDLFDSVYWSMNQITGVKNAAGAAVHIRRLSAEEAAGIYGLDEEQRLVLDGLSAMKDIVDEAVEMSIFSSLSPEEFTQISGQVDRALSPGRRAVLLSALSLNEKVDYFWGGKSLSYGWDDRWGDIRVVSCKGSSSYGTYRPLGLDCSGFVSWAFINAFGPDYGTLSSAGWAEAPAVEWEQAEPGDVAVTNRHVGIVLTVDENGPASYIHCNAHGVNITSDRDTFDRIVRPEIYDD